MMLNRDAAKPIVVAAVYHDLVKRQSTVALTWDGVADKRLVLEVPFGCSLSDIQQEAEKALREFASDIASAPMKAPADMPTALKSEKRPADVP